MSARDTEAGRSIAALNQASYFITGGIAIVDYLRAARHAKHAYEALKVIEKSVDDLRDATQRALALLAVDAHTQESEENGYE